jgi:hypothetical protein
MDSPAFIRSAGWFRGSDEKGLKVMSLANFDLFQRTADRVGGLFLLALGLLVGGATALVGF